MGEKSIKLCVDTKDLRKAAFAVGLGLTLGKFAGECVKAVFDGIALGLTRRMKTDKTKED